MNKISIDEFVKIFDLELEAELDEKSLFKMQDKWSSLNSLIIINEIESKTGIILTVEDIMQSDTIEDLYIRIKDYLAING